MRLVPVKVVALLLTTLCGVCGRYGEFVACWTLSRLPARVAPRSGRFTVDRHGLRWHCLDLADNIQRALFFVGTYESTTLNVLQRRMRSTDTIVDVGANIGAITLPLARLLGPEGRLIAVEAAHDTAEKLQVNITANNLDDVVELQRLALSDRSGLGTLHVGGHGADDIGTRTLEGDGTVVGPSVGLITGDDLLKSVGAERADILKIDVEGHELAVLRGLDRLLCERPPRLVVMEVVNTNQQRAGESTHAVVERMAELGYRGLAIRFRGLRPLRSNFNGNVVFEKADC